MITDINSEDRLVQQTFAKHLEEVLGWETVYAHNHETFGPNGTLGRTSERDVVLVRDLRAALEQLNPDLPAEAREQAVTKLTTIDFARSLIQHNHEFYQFIRDGVPVEWRHPNGQVEHARARVIDFADSTAGDTPFFKSRNRFLAVRELKIQGVRVPHYNRRADIVCFVNGLPLVFIELKAVYRNIRAGFDDNLTDYLNEHSIQHAFHHNAFLIVSNGDAARYGSITSKWEHFVEWRRNTEKDKARVDAEALLDGMLAKDRLLDIVRNFILFDNSRVGGTRKVVARNHQVLGVNNAVASVIRQETLKVAIPREARLTEYRIRREELVKAAEGQIKTADEDFVTLTRQANPELGRLGVFWHTQGSGKSYSMAFFVEKVRRVVPGNFTFLIMTDREDLDDQIWRTFVGCGVTDEKTPKAESGRALQALLHGNPRFIFSLIHKFNQPVTEPYSDRDDIIVMSDEAHRTQSGKFARNMRLALPNASFIGFTGTPLFKHDELTKRIFGNYISRYDFQRSVEEHSTVRLVYENRGEKLGIANLDLNDQIAEAIEEAELDADQTALLEKLLGKDYEVVTAPDRLEKLADDFVEHCVTRWQSGKSMLVCIDKITCARMFNLIEPRWKAKLETVTDPEQAKWMRETIIEIVISEAQNEVRDFQKWDFDIIPHRAVLKTGFETPDGKRVPVEDAFKDPKHPFRIAIVCAMWLTGFDVECLSTLYIDKPMKAHNLMQAIARANRIYPGKECGVIVDYNGVLKGLREALATYASGDDGDDGLGGGDPAVPIETLVGALLDALEAAEAHLKGLGFDVQRLVGATGFDRTAALRDAVDALYTSDEAKRRFEIMARQVFSRFTALLTEPSARQYTTRRDNIEAIYKKLQDKRDTSDVTSLLKELHKIVNEAIRTADTGRDHADGLKIDLSTIDLEKLRDEFASKVHRKHAVLQDMRELIEEKLAMMLARNPMQMDYYKKYQQIVADYNREKDRSTVEATFAELANLLASMDDEQRRAATEGLDDDQLALFDLMLKPTITKADRERVKQASRNLLDALKALLATMPAWEKTTSTQAEVRIKILDTLYTELPRPPFTEEETEQLANEVFDYVYARTTSGHGLDASF